MEEVEKVEKVEKEEEEEESPMRRDEGAEEEKKAESSDEMSINL